VTGPETPLEPGGTVEPAVASGVTGLADGEWHRLHPATPLLRGGFALVVIAGVIIANLRERFVEWFLPGTVCVPGDDNCSGRDPIDYLIDEGYLLIALGAVLGIVLVCIVFFWVSWRMHTFRVTDEVVEMRSGVLFRTHRKARLDRIQGISINRPLFARIFGTAKLDIEGAGQDANVALAYLGNSLADGLRADILRLASGSRAGKAAASAPGPAGSLIDRRVAELLAPELDPALVAPESVVRMSAGRLVGSSVLSGSAVFLVAALAAVTTILVLGSTVAGEFYWILFSLVPMVFGLGSYLVNRVVKFLRYSIAGTPDGVRVGYGLLSTRNETLPPGRIHSVAVQQNLLWRPADWWTVRVNRATRGSSSDAGQQAQQSTVVLPVGSREDVFRVLELLLPELLTTGGGDVRELLERGLAGTRGDDDFTTTPRRGAVLRWFSWRRNGFALVPGAVLLRRGAIWRDLTIVPTPRMQSVAIEQGPILRGLRLAGVHVHTVAGPITPRIGALDVEDAQRLFRDVAGAAVAAAALDRSHRWRSLEE